MSRITLKAKHSGNYIAVGLEGHTKEWFFQMFEGSEEEPVEDVDTDDHEAVCDLIRKHADLESPKVQSVLKLIEKGLDPVEYSMQGSNTR